MPDERTPGRPTTRRCTPEEKAQAVRLVRQMRAERGMDHGCIQRVPNHLGYGTESVRARVRQADIDDGERPGVTSAEASGSRRLSRR